METGEKPQGVVSRPANAIYGVFFGFGKITRERVAKAAVVYMQHFPGQLPGVIVATPARETEAREVATALGLGVRLCAGMVGGEFWLGEGE